MGKLLVVEDQSVLRKGIVSVFRDSGHDVDEAVDGETASEMLDSWNYDIVVTDLKLPGISGMELLRLIKSRNPSTDVLIMTAYGTVETAIEAMKLGAFDFIQKPFGLAELEMRVEKALQKRSLENEVTYLRHEREVIYRIEDLVGESPAIRDVYRIVEKVAPSNANVLITGETGTGKELIAGAIHYNSPRSRRSFVKVNCAAIPDNLLESELFGHEKGAFTGAIKQRVGRFEQADGGTILLDEIGDMSPTLQSKLLRVVQDRHFERLGGNATLSVDTRILSATNKDLALEMDEGNFREDLYYRLNVVTIHLPPLRERGGDVRLLADYFIRRFSGELGKGIRGLTERAALTIQDYDWPGNIRELENTLERAVLMSEGDYIDVDDL
ncbi:MAG: sigma-54-dependent Fis family transcriptional regulator, partial [bacterium]